MERTVLGVKGRDRNGKFFAVFYAQVVRIKQRPYGCDVQLDTGDLIPLTMGRSKATRLFTPPY